MKNLIYEVAKLTDVEALATLEKKCFLTDLITTQQFRSFIKKSSSVVFIVRDHDYVVGSAVILLRKNSTITRLYSIAIHPDWQNKGIAQALYCVIESYLKNKHYTEMRLEVKEDNTKAIRFYERNDFKIFGKYHNFYEDNTDALRMHKLFK